MRQGNHLDEHEHTEARPTLAVTPQIRSLVELDVVTSSLPPLNITVVFLSEVARHQVFNGKVMEFFFGVLK